MDLRCEKYPEFCVLCSSYLSTRSFYTSGLDRKISDNHEFERKTDDANLKLNFSSCFTVMILYKASFGLLRKFAKFTLADCKLRTRMHVFSPNVLIKPFDSIS